MPARWLLVLLFLAYLFGPSRPPEHEPPELAVAAMSALYSHAPPADVIRWTARLLGAGVTAAAVALTLSTLQRLAPARGAWLLTLVAAFASPLWSWTSRSSSPEGWAAFAVAAVLWLSVGRGSQRLIAVAFIGAVVAIVMVALRLEHGRAVDPTAAVAYLISPGRGIVWFVPLSILAFAALVRRAEPRDVVRAGAVVLLAAVLEVAARPEPWGPLGFGPTQLSPYVPLLAVMSAGLPRNWLRSGALLSLPVALAHCAAVFMGGHTWDERRMVTQNPEAVWDAVDSPFSDLIVGPPRPDAKSLSAAQLWMRPGDYITREGHPMPWLAYGWEWAEAKGVWASGRESWLALAVPPGDYVLTLIVSAPKRRGRNQSLVVERPGAPSLELTFSKQLWELEPLAVPFHAKTNMTVLKLRPAHTRIPGHGDVRRCSLFLAALRLERKTAELVPVVLATERGPIELAVDLARAPRSAANFLRYVDAGHYDGGVIHRTVKLDNQPDNKVRIEVIQGGVNPERKQDGFPPIAIERTRDTGLRHEDGTLSMARDGPDTATSDFFICIGAQPSLDFGGARNPDGQGFAAFGRVVSGMDVVREIQRAPALGQRLTPPVRILSARRR